jgi:hypothetical protein
MIEADLVNGLTKLRIVFSPVYVVARCAGDALPVHHALHKVIALHPIFVSGPIRKMSERRLPWRCATGDADRHEMRDRPNNPEMN